MRVDLLLLLGIDVEKLGKPKVMNLITFVSCCIDRNYFVFSLGDSSIMGDRRHKDELDSGDDSDVGEGDDEVSYK